MIIIIIIVAQSNVNGQSFDGFVAKFLLAIMNEYGWYSNSNIKMDLYLRK